MSSGGLSNINAGVSALEVPMMFESYDEIDYVRDRITAKLEQRIESAGIPHKPRNETPGVDLGLLEPAPHEIDNLVAHVGRRPGIG